MSDANRGGSSVKGPIRISRAVPDCVASMISVVDSVVSPICRQPPSPWPATSDPGCEGASRGGLQGFRGSGAAGPPKMFGPVPGNASACWSLAASRPLLWLYGPLIRATVDVHDKYT